MLYMKVYDHEQPVLLRHVIDGETNELHKGELPVSSVFDASLRIKTAQHDDARTSGVWAGSSVGEGRDPYRLTIHTVMHIARWKHLARTFRREIWAARKFSSHSCPSELRVMGQDKEEHMDHLRRRDIRHKCQLGASFNGRGTIGGYSSLHYTYDGSGIRTLDGDACPGQQRSEVTERFP